ncbi:MAG: STAS/SEC14 domain-containing protein [Phycisphaerae bacterium]|nr:STAS/SEC14 domain-containing protein [Phycisphaerae bacterium]
MAVEIHERAEGRILEVPVTGKLSREDYERFVPELERRIQQFGKIRLLFQMHDFHGWELGALWEDIKFDARHFRDIDRLAIVGEAKWQKGMAAFCRPFTTADIRYFEHAEIEKARAWLEEDQD